MSEVLRKDIFHFVSSTDIPMGVYRLCKDKPVDPQFFLPNLLVHAEPASRVAEPAFALSIISKQLYDSVEDGDIGIVNNGQMVRVILSRRANHNTILVTERCNNLCLFCSQPPKKGNDDELLVNSALAIAAFDYEGVIGISGGEPLIYGEEFLNFLRFVVDNAPRTALHVLTNGRRFSDTGYATKMRDITQYLDITFGIPLYGTTATIHDDLVGCTGAFNETMRGLINAGNLGMRIELRVIPTRQNITQLPDLVEYVSRVFSNVSQISVMGLESIGWARKHWDKISIDNYSSANVFIQLNDAATRSGIPLVFFNYPKCQLPRELWPLAVQSISDWKNYYPIECETCTLKSTCAGYFSSSTGRFHQVPRPII